MGILVYQFAYVKKVLEKFNIDKAYHQRTPMIVRALEKNKDPFRPKQGGEEVLGAECPYLSVIGALMYLENNTRPTLRSRIIVLKDIVQHLQYVIEMALRTSYDI
jgi:hypothetical protein